MSPKRIFFPRGRGRSFHVEGPNQKSILLFHAHSTIRVILGREKAQEWKRAENKRPHQPIGNEDNLAFPPEWPGRRVPSWRWHKCSALVVRVVGPWPSIRVSVFGLTEFSDRWFALCIRSWSLKTLRDVCRTISEVGYDFTEVISVFCVLASLFLCLLVCLSLLFTCRNRGPPYVGKAQKPQEQCYPFIPGCTVFLTFTQMLIHATAHGGCTNSNSKTLLYKNCSLGSLKNLNEWASETLHMPIFTQNIACSQHQMHTSLSYTLWAYNQQIRQ